jgi:cyclopropane fatty-acyl-phospholipid synthase-like methyltransferase
MTHDEKMKMLIDESYPLASKYDPNWMFENKMGGPCLWLCESLSRNMDLKPDMKVLDLGCGTSLTSIFLAKEFGVTVFATDLWVSASENQKRIAAANVENLVHPIHAEVHNMPFANNFFDAAVCINTIQFLGISEFFLGEYIAPLLKKDAQFGVVFFGPDEEFDGDVPAHMAEGFWPDFYYFHSLAWMRRLFERTRLFSIECGDDLDGNGRRVAAKWAKIMGKPEMDNHGVMRWNRMVAKRNHYNADDFRK